MWWPTLQPYWFMTIIAGSIMVTRWGLPVLEKCSAMKKKSCLGREILLNTEKDGQYIIFSLCLPDRGHEEDMSLFARWLVTLGLQCQELNANNLMIDILLILAFINLSYTVWIFNVSTQ